MKIPLNQEIILKFLAKNKELFAERYNIKTFGLFGSFARNEQNEKSDIDLIYITKNDKSLKYFDLYQLEKEFEKEFERKTELINYKFLNPLVKFKSKNEIIYV